MEQAPSKAAVIERAYSLVQEAMRTIELQIRRVRSEEPEDEDFLFRWWVDLQFLVIALRRLRRAAQLASRADPSNQIQNAISAFDSALPSLGVMRNVGEHINMYALDDARRHHKAVTRQQLQVGQWDGTTYSWLQDRDGNSLHLNVDEAREAAIELWATVREVYRSFIPPK